MLLWPSLILLLVLAFVWYARKLTLGGTITAGMLAVVIYAGTGVAGITLLGGFFVLGTGATLWRKQDKIKAGWAEKESSRRNAGQVLANGGVSSLLGLLAWLVPAQAAICLWMMAGAFSAAAADTLSSELGVLYGRRFINIRSLRPDQKGLDGVISLEGTLMGIGGSMLVALLLWLISGIQAIVPVLLAGTIGNLLDSYLGAVFERHGLLHNNWVNACNTLAGAVVMGLLFNGMGA